MSSFGGAGETNEHVHEGREQLSREEITTGGDEFVQAELTLRGPVKISINVHSDIWYVYTLLSVRSCGMYSFIP